MNNEIIAKELIKNGAATVTILTGAAPKQENLSNIEIKGDIHSVNAYLSKRGQVYNPLNCYVKVDKFNGKMTAIIGENQPFGQTVVIGEIKKGKIFSDLGINAETSYSTEGLSKKLRMMRSIFVDKDQHANIVAKLRNLVAQINREIEKQDDLKGNRSNVFRQKVESNIPDSLAIQLPIIEGNEPVKIEVNVILEVGDSGQVVCKLESVDAQELYDETVTKMIETEVGLIDSKIVVIYC
jgi:hypothetical protein